MNRRKQSNSEGEGLGPSPSEFETQIPAEELSHILEAIIFVADEPVSLDALKTVFKKTSLDTIAAGIRLLLDRFNAHNHGLEIREVGGGLKMSTRPEFHEWVRAYLKTRPSAKLSLAALETLAVIAYKQPVTLPEILDIRGIKSTSAIQTLLEKRLIVTKGRKKVVGRPILYGTSKEFLVHFGLRDLGELPTLEEFEEIAKEGG